MKNIAIIGAGVVGLSIAYQLSQNKKFRVFVLEKNKIFGLGNTIKNSQVIHSGIYYKKHTLKKKLAIKGNKLIYKFCKKNKIKCLKVGKLFVAKTLEEEKYLDILKKNALNNGIKDTKIINKNKLKIMEPNIIGNKALLSTSTGIFDVNSFINKLFQFCKKNNVKFKFKINKLNFKIKKKKFNEKNFKETLFDYVINSAGAEAIQIAKAYFPSQKFPQNNFVKGIYFYTKQNLKVKKIIYDAMLPGVIKPRIDITPMLNGGYMFGPNVQKKEKVDKKKLKDEFFKILKRSLHSINRNKILYLKEGIRTKIIKTTIEKNEDFHIRKIKKYNWINLFGIESPGLTSCLSIAQYVAKMIK